MLQFSDPSHIFQMSRYGMLLPGAMALPLRALTVVQAASFSQTMTGDGPSPRPIATCKQRSGTWSHPPEQRCPAEARLTPDMMARCHDPESRGHADVPAGLAEIGSSRGLGWEWPGCRKQLDLRDAALVNCRTFHRGTAISLKTTVFWEFLCAI
jgi:hypothetical protein